MKHKTIIPCVFAFFGMEVVLHYRLAVLVCGILGLALMGQSRNSLVLNPEQLIHGGQELGMEAGWLIWPGELNHGEDPNLDDRNWLVGGSRLTLTDMARIGWQGHGWFRLWLQVPAELRGKEIGLTLLQIGGSEVFFNGNVVHQMGTVGRDATEEIAYFSGRPFTITLADQEYQLLAVHFSGFAAELEASRPVNKGFKVSAKGTKQAFNQWWSFRSHTMVLMAFFLGLFLVFGLNHMFLYIFYPTQRANFFVASIGVAGVAISIVGLALMQPQSWFGIKLLNQLQQLITVTSFPLLIYYTYSAFESRTPRWAWLWFTLIPLDFILRSFQLDAISLVLQILGLLEIARRTIIAIWHKKPGSRILGVGILIMVVTVLLEVLGLAAPFRGILNHRVGLPFLGGIVLIVLISFNASKIFAETSKRLMKELERVRQMSEEKLQKEREANALEVERRLLEADHARKTSELEDARKLQLSMLPKKLPDHPHFEIAAYMATATEVGGDYYDFYNDPNGELTVAIGDATGHGSKAGTMVAAIKALFSILAAKPKLPEIFASINVALRKMHVRGMFMALILLKIEGRTIRYAVAGMPPLYLWRKATGRVEVHQVKALPLGGVGKFPYSESQLEMAPGDILVAMSDGLPEMFNPKNEMMGDARVETLIAESGASSAQTMVQRLADAGEVWRAERDQDDDLTLVVLQAK